VSRGATHPAFERAAREHRWTRTLAELRTTLNRDVSERDGWSWYVLPRGACVALRVREDRRREYRVSREDRPATAEAGQKWEEEVATFARELLCAAWTRTDEDAGEGVAIRWVEAIGVARCSACRGPLDDNARLYGDGETCSTCAAAARVAAARERRVPCACGCGVMVEIEPYHDPARAYWIPCGIRASQAEAAARKEARKAAGVEAAEITTSAVPIRR